MADLDTLYLRIAPSRFHFLKFILEGYDNLAILSSIDGAGGIVVLRYATESAGDLFLLLESIATQLFDIPTLMAK
jgi:hypothetical protein